MASKGNGTYEAPRVTEYGSVDDITEQKNKDRAGLDVDTKLRDLKGSYGF